MSAITTDSIDRESITIEAVFGLSGGELENEPLEIEGQTYRWWYEGVPEYVTSEFRNDRRPLKTVIVCEFYSQTSPPDGWSVAATYRTVAGCDRYVRTQHTLAGSSPSVTFSVTGNAV